MAKARGAAKKQKRTKAKAKKPRAKAAAKPRKKKGLQPRASGLKKRKKKQARNEPAPEPEPEPDLAVSPRRRRPTARERIAHSSPVVEILDDSHPIGALRRFLDSIRGEATEQQAQIALGAAQLLLQPREHRGNADVRDLVDLVLERWNDFGARQAGYHAREFLAHALVAVGVDRARVARLAALVPPDANAELRFDLACAYAVLRDKVAMLRAVDAALEAGATPARFAREHDFAPYRNDPDLRAVLARAEVPPIPVDIAPHVAPVRAALDSLVATLRELGEQPVLRPPLRLDAILDAERARRISLPNDYRALLSITNGMVLMDREFFGAGDYREATPLATRASRYVHGAGGIEELVPLAAWGDNWLFYDPRGQLRGGAPGYVIHDGAKPAALDGLVHALGWLEAIARDVLGTN
jgi:hypothetical protein